MDDEKLFELAVGLVQANIRAGQFIEPRNFDTIVHDQVMLAYNALSQLWDERTKEDTPQH